MKGCILLFSDVHADIGALDAILRLAGGRTFVRRYGRVERTFNLGDVVQRGYSPCEVIDRLKGIPGLTSVLGNHDEAFVWSVPVSGSDAQSLEAHDECHRRGGWEEFFHDMPVAYADSEERLYVVHGGPLRPDGKMRRRSRAGDRMDYLADMAADIPCRDELLRHERLPLYAGGGLCRRGQAYEAGLRHCVRPRARGSRLQGTGRRDRGHPFRPRKGLVYGRRPEGRRKKR